MLRVVRLDVKSSKFYFTGLTIRCWMKNENLMTRTGLMQIVVNGFVCPDLVKVKLVFGTLVMIERHG